MQAVRIARRRQLELRSADETLRSSARYLLALKLDDADGGNFMSALVAALFKDHETAESVRTALVTEGFPTDRVQLTSASEPGPAALTPSGGKTDQLQSFFARIFPAADERAHLQSFVEGVRQGNAAVIVHPRGEIETQRALGILSSSDPIQMRKHDLANQSLERAASKASSTVLGKFVPEEVKTAINPRKN
jgi:hypothetical protein